MPPLLVVDDNIDIAESMGLLLRLSGHEVYVAYGAREALALAREHHPAVAILDIGLPGEDGFALARLLRAIPGLKKIRLIAVTAYGDQRTRQRLAECGFEKHFVKPARMEAIEAAISQEGGDDSPHN